ncbi:MAG TPA: hypothetical protein VFT64_10515 [Rickettsiales bacterium]|nr:hypothetical protein [Rickettsiales bacterium]
MKNFPRIFTICFILVFLLAGIIGHDPWKQDETYTFGIIYHFYTTHSWLIPTNAGVPFMEKPPLYYWSAVILCKALSPWLALHNAARLTSFFYMLVTCGFLWKTCKVLFRGKEHAEELRITALLLFLGTIGVLRHSHDMFTDVALLTGFTVTLYGASLLACENMRWKEAGLWLGIGAGIAFLSKGMFVLGIFGISLPVLLVLMKRLRTLPTLNALLLAGVVASPFFVIWPLLLYRDSPALFTQWLWENNVGRFVGFSVSRLGANNECGYVLYSVFWFCFPVFPLVLLRTVRRIHDWRRKRIFALAPQWLLPAVLSVVGLLLLLISASSRALYMLPLIPAFTVLAAPEVLKLNARFTAGWNHMVRILFLATIILLWIVWGGLMTGHNLAAVARVFPVNFMPPYSQWPAVLVAILATVCFLFLFRLRARDVNHLVLIWFFAVASVWIVGMMLLLPWTDETRSYRTVLTQMQEFIDHSPYRGEKMEEYRMGESVGPMFEYFMPGHRLNIVPQFDVATAPLLFTVELRSEHLEHGPGWKLIWQGARALDTKDEELRLYARKQ